ncbi:MAG: phage portal protein [Lysobacteraceae bacterium]
MAQSLRQPGRLRAAWGALRAVPSAVRAMATRSASISDAASSAEVFGVDLDGVSVTPRTALQLSAVWACVRLISETIATLPIGMHERVGAGRRYAPQHALHGVLHDVPNPDATAAVFWESMVAAMLLRGAGRAEKLVYNGRVVGLEFLAPERLWPNRRQGQRVLDWRYTEDTGLQRVIPAERVWTVPGFSLDGKSGVSAIRYGSVVFGNAMSAEKFATRTFTGGRLQSMFYTIGQWLKKDQRDEFHQNIAERIRLGQAPLLEGGIDAKTLGINPDDAQLLESRGFSVEEICRWFRVPPFMVGHSEKSTSWGTGIEQQTIGFLTFTLRPWLTRIEQAVAKDLLTPAERLRYYPKFSVEGLLRGDSTGRAAFYTAMVNNGVLTRDEVRELEDREPMGGNAAVLTVQSAMTTLDALGQQSDANAARAALRGFLGVTDPEPTKD